MNFAHFQYIHSPLKKKIHIWFALELGIKKREGGKQKIRSKNFLRIKGTRITHAAI